MPEFLCSLFNFAQLLPGEWKVLILSCQLYRTGTQVTEGKKHPGLFEGGIGLLQDRWKETKK